MPNVYAEKEQHVQSERENFIQNFIEFRSSQKKGRRCGEHVRWIKPSQRLHAHAQSAEVVYGYGYSAKRGPLPVLTQLWRDRTTTETQGLDVAAKKRTRRLQKEAREIRAGDD
jgi:hypothetical protein